MADDANGALGLSWSIDVDIADEEKVGSLETFSQISFDVWRSGAVWMNIQGALAVGQTLAAVKKAAKTRHECNQPTKSYRNPFIPRMVL